MVAAIRRRKETFLDRQRKVENPRDRAEARAGIAHRVGAASGRGRGPPGRPHSGFRAEGAVARVPRAVPGGRRGRRRGGRRVGRVGAGAGHAKGRVGVADPAGVQPVGDRDLRLLVQAAAVRPAADASSGGTRRALADETWTATALLDKLGLFTTEVYQKAREEVIGRQQQEMLELSTPVVKLWEGILALPMIGTLDSGRTQVVMESLLQPDRRDRGGDRDPRHHRRADGGHAGGPAPASRP